MSTGLVASTVTPGSTAPDESRTVPVMDAPAWANAAQGSATLTQQRAQCDLAVKSLVALTGIDEPRRHIAAMPQ